MSKAISMVKAFRTPISAASAFFGLVGLNSLYTPCLRAMSGFEHAPTQAVRGTGQLTLRSLSQIESRLEPQLNVDREMIASLLSRTLPVYLGGPDDVALVRVRRKQHVVKHLP